MPSLVRIPSRARSTSSLTSASMSFSPTGLSVQCSGENQLPLLQSESVQAEESKLNTWALACLLLQHLSNTFNTGLYQFAIFLFLIEVYADTLVPASLVGLFSTLSGFMFSGWVGGLVDRIPRLKFIRFTIGGEKILIACNYALFIALFGPLRSVAEPAFHGQAEWTDVVTIWSILLSTTVFSIGINLANNGVTVAIERDWVITIAQGKPDHLTLLNTYMRRIDLFSKLMAPLFVSLLTAIQDYQMATFILLVISLGSFVTEFMWTEVVYKRFPILSEDEEIRKGNNTPSMGGHQFEENRVSSVELFKQWLKRERDDWIEFYHLPIFASSISISTIYLTTLSYDGTFISYLKAARGWNDTFIALMRGLCVITGLVGTWVMPRLEKKIGLERAGAWSIWFEICCLFPVSISFFAGAGKYGEHGPVWNSLVLFGGIALSRIGLWSFDLCQLKELQLALDDHPHRNRLTALQISLQNLFHLLKYAVTLSASTPKEFKWTALVSFGALLVGGCLYTVYLRGARGHLIHFDWYRKVM
ncbi:hypothetical protein AYX14_00563 [Cryptococcus neoformans]|nr:hypothetical protein AYX15_02012 [Cryptococcus neoformans var. grubii]OWZ73840.1 hypothetical protein AYX14_00563 [Cryptococcus neoformans var. grubii]